MATCLGSPRSKLLSPFHFVSLVLWIQILLFFSGAEAQGCSKSNPCAIGCCSKFGFCGLGADFCNSDICVDTCDSKGDCNPGDWDSQYFRKETCPLNVCCSKFGFCGTTDEFCGDNKVKRPSYAVNGQGFQRVVGYYEGWSPDRPCNQFYPEQIPKFIYTHLNFAFATIDPISFEVMLTGPNDEDLVKRLTNLKKADPGLSVFVALGGWTFNDPGPTATTFGDIARSEANTKKFTSSLISFMSTYNFDGVDLDWEYPEADDRSGQSDDYANLSTFLGRIKSALKATGGRDGLSITLPASYWYLQHFDLQKIQNFVDFFNIMTYDFHGTWDMGNKWVGPYLNPHTNLTEIEGGLDLLWRNGVKEDKVVLGVAFYGRSFTVSNPDCTGAGCEYASGGNKQLCSHETSVVLNSEIIDIQKRTGATSVLLKDAAVKKMVYDANQWVTYDDEDTFKIRADYARSLGLGGLMVWAVSHDTQDATFNIAFAKAANRKYQAVAQTDDGSEVITTPNGQCKWTNCLENCPSGWVRMTRKDGGERGIEYMVDQGGCLSGKHQLCCPPDDVPTCGWYTHNNGKCDQKCGDGMIEIGSNSMYCNNKNYQAACCTVTQKSMHVHNTCTWSKAFPKCDSDTCSTLGDLYNHEYARSGVGSGGATCKQIPSTVTRENRKYCCREDEPDRGWDDCEWYTQYGLFSTKWPEDSCYGGCPDGKVRVAMDYGSAKGCGRGASARCCTPRYSTVTKRATAPNQEFDVLLESFLGDPHCIGEEPDHTAWGYQNTLIDNVQDILFGTPDATKIEIWDQRIGSTYPFLKFESLKKWSSSDSTAILLGSTGLPKAVLCGLAVYNSLIAGSAYKCACTLETCGTADDSTVINRRLISEWSNETHAGILQGNFLERSLVKRAPEDPRDLVVRSALTGAVVEFTISMMGYPSTGEWEDVSGVFQRAIDFSTSVCTNVQMSARVLAPLARAGWDTEHPFERQTFMNMVANTIQGILPSLRVPTGQTATIVVSAFPPLDPTIWAETALAYIPTNVLEPWPSAAPEWAIMRRLTHCLGSNGFTRVLTLAMERFNGMKGSVWGYNDPVALSTMRNLVNGDSYAEFFLKLKLGFGIIEYFSVPVVQQAYVTILTGMRWNMGILQYLHYQSRGVEVDLVGRFDEWWTAHLNAIISVIQVWATQCLDDATKRWAARVDIMQTIDALRLIADGLAIARVGFPTNQYQITAMPPTPP